MRLARAILGLVGTAVLCTQASGTSERDLEAELATVVAAIETPADLITVRDALVRLGGQRIDLLFSRLTAETHALRRAALVSALDKLPRDAVVAHLSKVARQAGDEERRNALDVLARIGSRAEVRLCVDLANAAASTPLTTLLRDGLEQALAGICERDAGAPRVLAQLFPQARPAVQALIVDVITERIPRDAPVLLAGFLDGTSAETAALVLLSVGEAVQASGEVVEDALVLERVRGFLGHADRRIAVLACTAIDKLRDHEAVPELIVLLEDSDANVRKRAHATLVGLTGLPLSADAEPWIAWLDDSLTWWEERAEACRVALVSGTAAEAAAALLEVARQRLFVHEVVRLVALAQHRTEPDLVRSACRVLGTIPDARATHVLARLALHPDPDLAELALAGIQRQRRASAPSTRSISIRFPSRSATP